MTIAAEPRRLSICHRHPSADPITGFCGPCLRERLSYLDSPSPDPDLRRCKSFSSSKLAAASDLRRKSCDVRPRTSLSLLFKSDPENRTIPTQSHQLGFPQDDKTEEEEEEEKEEIDGKTMKEHIELELDHSSKRYTGLWGGAASVFTQKLQKWRSKQQMKKSKPPIRANNADMFKALPPEKLTGRRSCDTEPRFSLDENPHRFSFEEPRASWDGYMIARTIPRLAPMLSVIENAMNEEQLAVEDETNSISESSSSQRRNSFDCSSSGKSSGKHRAPVEIEDLKLGPKESPVLNLYDNPSKRPESGSLKKRVLNILGFKIKSKETREIVDLVKDCEKQIGGGNRVKNGSCKTVDYSYHRSPNVAEIRGPAIAATSFDRNRSVRYSHSPSSFENGLLRIHLTPPLALSRKKKSERRSMLNSQSSVRGVSRLN